MTARVLDGQGLAVRMQEEIKPAVAAFAASAAMSTG